MSKHANILFGFLIHLQSTVQQSFVSIIIKQYYENKKKKGSDDTIVSCYTVVHFEKKKMLKECDTMISN